MYYITTVSKNTTSIKRLYTFFNNINSDKTLNLNIIKKLKKNTQKKQLFTILKSPHVNKTAQEQFQFKIVHKQLFIKPAGLNLKFLLLLKKVLSELFPDTRIIIKIISSKNLKNQTNNNIFSLNNFKIDNKFYFKRLNSKLKILNNYGEFYLK